MKNLLIILPFFIFLTVACDQPSDDNGQSHIAEHIQSFVDNENLPDAQEVNVQFYADSQGVTIFSVPYGPPHDCPSGCFYSSVYGIDSERQIGWVLHEDYTEGVVDTSNRYNFDEYETAMYDTSLLSLIRESERGSILYWNMLSGLLARNEASPTSVLEHIALSLYEYIAPSATYYLLSNPRIRSEISVLCLMRNNPLASNQGFGSAIRDSLGANISECDG